MTAIKSGEAEKALRQRDISRHPLVLLYGPDHGLVAERARGAATAVLDDPSDPFALVRLDGDTVAAEPGSLADEAGTVGLFGGRRSIWVRSTARNLVPAVTACLDLDLRDTSIVIEAGELSRSAPLRVLCERSPKSLAIPCYADGERNLESMIDAMVREAGLSIGRSEKALLLQSLGGDRLASRGEIAKLLLYCRGQDAVSVADIEAVVSDVSAGAVDVLVDAAFSGRIERLDDAWQRLSQALPAQALIAALRHALQLVAARSEVEGGKSIDAVAAAWPALHFSRKASVQGQLGLWTASAAQAAVERLQAAVLETRRQSGLAPAIVSRAFIEVARQARQSGGRRHPQPAA